MVVGCQDRIAFHVCAHPYKVGVVDFIGWGGEGKGTDLVGRVVEWRSGGWGVLGVLE